MASESQPEPITVERFGCRAVAVEPVGHNLSNAFVNIEGHPQRQRIDLRPGSIGAIPAVSGEFSAIWSRDMLNHIADLDGALRECHRVLRQGCPMLVYQTFATPLLEPAEAARLYADLAVVPERMDPAGFEHAVAAAGFGVERLVVVGSQWREAWEESGEGRTSRQLLHAARLLRCRDEMQAELGDVDYRVELANALWGVYQMIGKLEPRIYVLRRL